MAGKRDQSEISLSEFRNAGMVESLRSFYGQLENLAMDTLDARWSTQAVNRLKKSAKKYGISPLELLGRFVRKG